MAAFLGFCWVRKQRKFKARSPVRENCTPGSVREAPRKGRSYRDAGKDTIKGDQL